MMRTSLRMIGCGGSGSNAGRANRRGDSTGPVADRTPARAGSHVARNHVARNHGPAFPDVDTGIPSRRENLSGRRADFAGEPGSLALEPGADRGGSGVAGESPEVPPLQLLHTAGCDCGRSCGGGILALRQSAYPRNRSEHLPITPFSVTLISVIWHPRKILSFLARSLTMRISSIELTNSTNSSATWQMVK